MRFDLLDEYSTIVPFGLGVSRNRPNQDLAVEEPAVPPKVAERGTIATFASQLKKLGWHLAHMKSPSALRHP